MLAKLTVEQRIKEHMKQARCGPCPPLKGRTLQAAKRKFGSTHQEFWLLFNKDDHRALGLWAAACAEHVLPFFEKEHSSDTRPRDAIQTLRIWAQTGEFSIPVIRGASLAAHAAARDVKAKNSPACYAARAAGQAVATAHVPTHALGPALYALKAVAAACPGDVQAAISRERNWQLRRVPRTLRDWVVSRMA
jgi:hypothetical protein